MEALLHRHNRLNHWPLVIYSVFSSSPLPICWGRVCWKFQPSNYMVGSSDNQPPSRSYIGVHQAIQSPHQHKLRYGWKGLIMNNQRHSSHPSHSGNSQGFRSSMPETENKDLKTKYIFLIFLTLPFVKEFANSWTKEKNMIISIDS